MKFVVALVGKKPREIIRRKRLDYGLIHFPVKIIGFLLTLDGDALVNIYIYQTTFIRVVLLFQYA